MYVMMKKCMLYQNECSTPHSGFVVWFVVITTRASVSSSCVQCLIFYHFVNCITCSTFQQSSFSLIYRALMAHINWAAFILARFIVFDKQACERMGEYSQGKNLSQRGNALAVACGNHSTHKTPHHPRRLRISLRASRPPLDFFERSVFFALWVREEQANRLRSS